MDDCTEELRRKMLEPEIKFENCDEIYSDAVIMSNAGHLQMRANEDGINGGGDGVVANAAARQKRNYNDHLQSLSVCGGNPNSQQEPYGANNYNSVTLTPSMNAQNFYSMQQQQPKYLPPADPVKKRPRRYETNILFQHPFFNLLEDWDSARTGEAITAKCLSCGVTLRGHKNVSSNFIKHMKRLHPELYKVYESYKIMKFKGHALGDTLGGGQVRGEQSFFDASAFLEHMASTAVEEQNSTETSSTPPTEGVETGEYNVSIQETEPAVTTSACSVRLVSQEQILDPKPARSEVDLSAKTLEQMSQMLDSKLNGFVTIAQLQEERKTIINMMDSKLEETLNPSQTDNVSSAPTLTSPINPTDVSMQTQIDALKAECEQLRHGVKRAQQSKQHMQAEIQAIDRAVRHTKLFVRNVPIVNSEGPKQAVERVLRDMLHLPDVHVKNVIPLASQNNKLKSNLMVELHKAHDTQAILRNCGKLKNTGIVVETALGPHALRRKHKLLVLRRELLRRNAQLKVLVRNTQLFVGGKEFYWDVVDGLGVARNQLDDVLDTEDDIVEVLNEATGLEMKEFLNVLKNYNVK